MPRSEIAFSYGIFRYYDKKALVSLVQQSKYSLSQQFYKVNILYHNNFVKNDRWFVNLLMEQFLPSYPGTQLQLKSLTLSVQVPPCSHGIGEHSSISGVLKKIYVKILIQLGKMLLSRARIHLARTKTTYKDYQMISCYFHSLLWVLLL